MYARVTGWKYATIASTSSAGCESLGGLALLERAADILRILRRGAQLQQIVHLHQAHTAAVFLIGRGELPGGRDDRLRLLAGDERDARRRHGIARCK